MEDLIMLSVRKQNYAFLVFTHLGKRETGPLFLSFQSCWFGEQALENSNSIFLLSYRQECLLYNIKDSVSLNSKFLSCNKTHCRYRCHLALSVLTLWEMCLRKPKQENDDIRDTVIAIIKSFVSGLGILCLLPATIKW